MANYYRTSSLALKLVLLLISCISFFLLAKLLIPHIANLLSIALPQILTVLSAWFAPPYLFITVHLIILVIWKLSDQKEKPTHTQRDPELKPKLSHEISPHEISRVLEEPKYKISSEISPNEIPGKISPEISKGFSRSDGSCLTEEKYEERSSSTASSRLDKKRVSKPALEMDSVKMENQIQSTVVEEKTEEGDVDDSMDAMWKAIMENVPKSVNGAKEKEPSVGEDEMNRRFEDFIKKSRDQIASRAF